MREKNQLTKTKEKIINRNGVISLAAENAYKYIYNENMSAAPELERKEKLQKAKSPDLSRRTSGNADDESIRSDWKSTVSVLKIAAFSAVIAAVYIASLFMHGLVIAKAAEYDRLVTQYELSVQKGVELDARLSALNTLQNIDTYAVEVFGFVKSSSGNEEYIDSSENKVIFSAEETGVSE